MTFEELDTPSLLKLWDNMRGGLDKINETIEKGTFHTVGTKGAAPPSQSGQMTVWFALAIHTELTKRGVTFK